MLKIGDFAILSKISIHMLRHYDQIDLLKPTYIDASSGYRYYTEEQLPIANQIQALKEMGCSLPIIKQILDQYNQPESLKEYLVLQRNQKKEELSVLKKQIRLLDNAIMGVDNNTDYSNLHIAIKEIPKRKVVSYRQTISNYSDEGILWQYLYKKIAPLSISEASPSYDIAIIHPSNPEIEGIDVEVQLAITKLYNDFDDITFKEVPAIKVASFTYQGQYDQIEHINIKIAKWIADNQYEFVGGLFNIYHISPKTESHQENLITEVCFPIKNKKA
ncbi:MAG: MerR family transcriptional regulator [Coprobacillaceae bacterium]